MQQLANTAAARSRTAQIPSGQIELEGELSVPLDATGIVLLSGRPGRAMVQRHLVTNVSV